MAAICKKCGKEIEGSILEAEGDQYHPECFVCDGCGEPFTSGYSKTDDGKRLCGKCNKARIDDIAEICFKCGARITGEKLECEGKVFHPACFACTNCNKAPIGSPFYPQPDGNMYCEKCNKTHKVKDVGQLRCAKCNQKIDGKVLNADGKDWHPECFTCDFCNKQLGCDDGTVSYSTTPDGDKACDECADKLSKGTLQPKKKAPAPVEAPVAAAPATDDAGYAGILTLAQLTDASVWKPLGVKASTREKNLSDEEFKKCFDMDKAAFAALPKFKQEVAKKKHNLF